MTPGLSDVRTEDGLNRGEQHGRPSPWSIGRDQLAVGGVLLITLLAYLKCLGNPFTLDDHLFLENALIGQWSFLSRSLTKDLLWFLDATGGPISPYYRPLLLIVLGLEYHLFGHNPTAFHATPLMLHLLVVWLVYKLATRLTGDRYAALLAALLFGLTPVHAEAVLSIAATNYPLCAALQLAAFYLIMQQAGTKRGVGFLSLGLYVGALLCHESAVVFPALVALYVLLLEPAPVAHIDDSILACASLQLKRALVRAAPFLAAVIVYAGFRVFVLHLSMRTSNPGQEVNGATVLLTLPRVVITYVVLMVVPWMAGDSDRVPFARSATSPDFYLAVATLIALAGCFYVGLRNHPRRRLYLFCVLWAALGIAPMMNLRGLWPQGEIANRYFYLPSVGWCVMVADWAVHLARSGTQARRLVWVGTASVLVVCLAVLMNLQSLWHDEVALIEGRLERYPESAYCHYALSRALMERGDVAGAEREREIAAKLPVGN